MTDELDEPFAPSEMNCEGSLFDTEEMARLAAAYYQDLFFWNDDYIAMIYRSCPGRRKAAPIAEGGLIRTSAPECVLAPFDLLTGRTVGSL